MTYHFPSCCQSTAMDDDLRWWCTLDAGHKPPHEAHGCEPLPAWDDTGIVVYLGDDGEAGE